MFSQSELIFRIEIKCAIFKRIIENLPCLQFASKPASVTRRIFFRGKRLMMSCVKTLIIQSNRYMLVILYSLGDP